MPDYLVMFTTASPAPRITPEVEQTLNIGE